MRFQAGISLIDGGGMGVDFTGEDAFKPGGRHPKMEAANAGEEIDETTPWLAGRGKRF